MILTDDGGAVIFDAARPELSTIVAPAWALDANGSAVPTRYEVTTDGLVQVVEHRTADVAYPVVADPEITIGIGAYVWFNRAETATIAGGGWAVTGGTAVCIAAGTALGGPGGGAAMGAACLAYLGTIAWVAGTAENSSPKRCLMINWTPVVGMRQVTTYRGSRCG